MDKEQLIYQMLTESTGINMMDNGGGEGRHWQRNQKKTLADFKKEPAVVLDTHDFQDHMYTISVFHYLNKDDNLELDKTCDRFNELACDDWESEVYGVSTAQNQWLLDNGFAEADSRACFQKGSLLKIESEFNTYNHESNLSQVLQGTVIKNTEEDYYVLLQIHQGADVRGGYTDAKMFKLHEDFMALEDVYGMIDGVQVDNRYDGINLTDDDGKKVDVKRESKIELWIE